MESGGRGFGLRFGYLVYMYETIIGLLFVNYKKNYIYSTFILLHILPTEKCAVFCKVVFTDMFLTRIAYSVIFVIVPYTETTSTTLVTC